MHAWDYCAGEKAVARSEGAGAAALIRWRAQSDHDDACASPHPGASRRSGRAAPDVAAGPAGGQESIGETDDEGMGRDHYLLFALFGTMVVSYRDSREEALLVASA